MYENLVSFAITTHNRSQELQCCLDSILRQHYRPIEIVVLDNGSTDATQRIMNQKYNLPFIHYLRLSQNKGSVEGKNIATRNCKGNVIISIDDDALLISSRATEKVLGKLSQDKKIGILAFKSLNHLTADVARDEFPRKDKFVKPDQQFETSYFVGVGYAITRKLYEQVGLYPPDFFFGFEELDLSFRTIDAEYKIIYYPGVEILHKKSPAGRLTHDNLWLKRLENRVRVSIRNLPWRYVISSAILWSGYTLLNVRGNLCVVVKAFWNIAKDMPKLVRQRKRIQPQTLKKLKQLKGRLCY